MHAEKKNDMERIGLFSEMSYITIGDKYVSHYMRPFNEAASKNKQMLSGGSKSLSALQAGYFDPKFARVFDGEAYSDPVWLRRRHRLAEAKKNLGKAFRPSNGFKLPCGLGSYYGTIGGSYAHFSSQCRAKGKYIPPGKNFYTNPGKKGTGYGYPNLTIGDKYPYKPDDYDAPRKLAKKEREEHKRLIKGGPFKLNLYPQDYFEKNPYLFEGRLPPLKKAPPKKPLEKPFKPSSPAKKPGGMKGGTFDRYPSHSVDPYVIKKPDDVTTNKNKKIFLPPPGPKSRPVSSIVALNVKR
ncbi:CD047 protein, partial [Alcedo cyanopectus]|nr:CD047 protein [Ceyx cyanopectus]